MDFVLKKKKKNNSDSKVKTMAEMKTESTEGEPTVNGGHHGKDKGEKNGILPASLDELQSDDYRRILDVVDRLRLSGLGSILQLPQIVVCGDQSSGKSSVLEAVTEVPFPRKENLCTRFATEIVMRRDRQDSITTKIIPDKARPDSEIAKLEAFRRSIRDFRDLPQLIEEATDLMGLNAAESTGRGTKAFTRDVLSVEIAGPNRLQLTLVDLPGLIMSANKQQTDEDVKLIHELVQDYISQDRTIMLAVVSAKNDYANQGILDKCRKVDPEGHRTMGIITKPDFLKTKAAEDPWFALAQNSDIYFELGWHMLKNRSEEQMGMSFEERNNAEAAFFTSGRYRELPLNNKGIITLRTKLAQVLYRHLKTELPNLQSEIKTKHDQVKDQLGQLGAKRSTVSEQKTFLMDVSSQYRDIVNDATNGHYEAPFFGNIDTTKSLEEANNTRRLRAVVQYLNLQFASQMRQYGHKFRIMATNEAAGTNSDKDLPEPALSEDYAEARKAQTSLSREQAVAWVKELLVRTRGRELPGNFNPLLMCQLFWEQSEYWQKLALDHVDRVHAVSRAFVHAAIDSVAFDEISARLRGQTLDLAMAMRYNAAKEELTKLVNDKQRTPVTYDPGYTANVQESRTKKVKARFDALMAEATVVVYDGHSKSHKSYVNPDLFKNSFTQLMDLDMDKASAEDALDSQLAYYKDKVKNFIAAVTEQVIERHLLHDLGKDTFSPMLVDKMDDELVSFIAAEAPLTTQRREYLEGQKAMLENGQEAFRKALGSYK